MVYNSPRLSEEINEEIHSEELYINHYKLKVLPSFEYRRNVLAKKKYHQVMKYFNKPGRVLDIGCGLGDVLSVFDENGWECLGIDFNKFAADFVTKQFGIDVLRKNIFQYKTNKKFDLIMLWGVLEHVYHPFKLLVHVKSLLHDDGIMLIEVPSADSLLVRYCEHTSVDVDRTFEEGRHIMLFSVQSLIEMCKKAGFVCIDLYSNGLDISTINNIKSVNLSNKQKAQLQNVLDDSLQSDLLRGYFKKG